MSSHSRGMQRSVGCRAQGWVRGGGLNVWCRFYLLRVLLGHWVHAPASTEGRRGHRRVRALCGTSSGPVQSILPAGAASCSSLLGWGRGEGELPPSPPSWRQGAWREPGVGDPSAFWGEGAPSPSQASLWCWLKSWGFLFLFFSLGAT